MTNRQIKIKSTGAHVAKLRKGQTVTYINPVAAERAKIMNRTYKYIPIVSDPYTLKPNKFNE